VFVSEDISPEAGRDSGDYLSFKPGQRLKKARELRGLSVDQVVSDLRLSRRIVEGIEADDYASLPEPAFVRGYMRRYAQLVKLSPDDIAARFDESYAVDTATPEPDVRPRNPIQILGDLARPRLRPGRLLSWVSLAVIVLLFAGFFWVRQDNSISEPVVESVETPVAPTAPVPTAAVTIITAPTVTAAPDNTAVAMDVLPSPSGPAVLPPPVGAAAQRAVVPAPLSPAAATDALKIVLTADSWLSVRDASGRVLVSTLRKSGETLNLSGAAPFAVNVGNAPGVTMSINGKAVDLKPHTRGAVAILSVTR